MFVINKNIFYKILIFIINLLFSFCLIFMLSNQIRTSMGAKFYSNSIANTNYLRIFDTYGFPGYTSYSDFLKKEDSFAKLNSLYEELLTSNSFKFLEVHDSMLQLKGNYKNGYEFISGYGVIPEEELKTFANQYLNIDGVKSYYSNIKSTLIGEKTFNQFQLEDKISNGRAFILEDFYLNGRNDVINVILGYEYTDIYKINDEFKALYSGFECNFKVIGFLEKNTMINFFNKFVPLDYNVIIPSFNISPQTFDDSDKRNKVFYNIHYSNKTWGFIVVNDKQDANSVKGQFESIAKGYNLEYYCEPFGGIYENKNIAPSLSDINQNTLFFSTISIIILCITMTLTFIKNFDKNIKNYSIYLVNGVSLNTIKKKIYFEIVILIFVSCALSLFTFYILNRSSFAKQIILFSISSTFVIELISFGIIFFITNNYINKAPIYLSLRRRE